MKKKSKITIEQLTDFGMKKTKDPLFPMIKHLSKGSKADDLGPISLCITRERNVDELCLHLPDGASVYLSVETIEDLKTFEKCIGSWSPVW